MIQESGYAIDLEFEAGSRQPIEPSGWYQYVARRGFVRSHEGLAQTEEVFSGRVLVALSQRHHRRAPLPDRQQAKRLIRMILSEVVGRKRILSRDLFYPRLVTSDRHSNPSDANRYRSI